MPPVAAVFGAIGAGLAVAGTAVSLVGSSQQAAASKKAAIEAQAQNDAAIQSVKDSQAKASTNAANTIQKRVSAASQTVYTSPLGLAAQADTARKTLLGQ